MRVHLEEVQREDVDMIHLVQMGTSCEHGNEPSGFITSGEFLG